MEQAVFLGRAGAGDAELQQRVEELLQAHLGAEDVEQAELVRLRYFAGLTLPEAAQVLSIPESTAKRRWTFARGWLFREIRPQQAPAGKVESARQRSQPPLPPDPQSRAPASGN